MERSIKRIVAVISLSVPVMAVETAITEVPYYDQSSISEDFSEIGFDPATYKPQSDGCEVVYVGETGYNKSSANGYNLYIYVYNPSEKSIKSVSMSNTVNIANKYENGKAVGFTRVRIELLKTEGQFMKFKVASANIWKIAKELDRKYAVSSLSLVFGNKVESYTVGREWHYSGSSETKDLSCTVTEYGVADIDLHGTTYYYNNGTVSDTILYSVWFSIDPRYEKETTKLTGYEAAAYRAELSSIAVVDKSKTVEDANCPGNCYEKLKSYVGVKMPEQDGNSYPFLTSAVSDHNFCYYGWNLKEGVNEFRYGINDSFSKLIFVTTKNEKGEKVGEIFDLTYLFDSPINEQWIIKNSAIENYAKNYKGSITGKTTTIGGTTYSMDLFKKQPEHVQIVKDSSVDSFTFTGAGSNGFEKFFLKHFWHVETKDIPGIEVVKQVTAADVSQNEFEKILFIGDDEKTEFKNFVKTETGKGNNVYLLRFATEKMSGVDLYYHYNAVNAGGLRVGTLITDSVAYLDFEVLSLHYTDDKGNMSVLPTKSNHVDIVPDIKNPVDNPSIDNAVQDFTEWFTTWFFGFVETVKKVVAVVAVIILVLLLMTMLKTPIQMLIVSRSIKKGRKDMQTAQKPPIETIKKTDLNESNGIVKKE